jgi:hypothetical protein
VLVPLAIIILAVFAALYLKKNRSDRGCRQRL